MLGTFKIANKIEEAIELKKSNLAFLAGGTEINRLGSIVKVDGVISLKKLALDKIEKNKETISIGSMVTFQKLIDEKEVPLYLKKAAENMASRTRRNMATVGGNLAVVRDDSYLLPLFLACDADLEMAKNGKIKLLEFINNRKKYDNDLILKAIIPLDAEVYQRRVSNTALSHSVLNAVVCKTKEKVRVFAALKGTGIVSLDLEKKDWISEIKTFDDMFGGAKYKKYILKVNVDKMLEEVGGPIC
ncbi:MAG: FAD binding domain-containing protein [Sphaerochaetaceae bacterium]|nr:FAD binding domain-containing protein [Sphaerochaetaceae bacterium]